MRNSNISAVPQSDDEDDEYLEEAPEKTHFEEVDYGFSQPEYTYPEMSSVELDSDDNDVKNGEIGDKDVEFETKSHDFVVKSSEFSKDFDDLVHKSIDDSRNLSSTSMASTITKSKSRIPGLISSLHETLDTENAKSKLSQLYMAVSPGPAHANGSFTAQETSQMLVLLEKSELEALRSAIEKQHRALNSGKNPSGVRSAILRSLGDLVAVFEQLSKHYKRTNAQQRTVLRSFEAWEANKEELNGKITEINKKMSHNEKLSMLESQNNELSAEIETLEAKLKSLKGKREVLQREIDITRSVIEGEKTTYIKSIKDIEKAEQEAASMLIKESFVHPQMSTRATALSNRNVVDNLRLAFGKFAPISTQNVDIAEILSELKAENRKTKASQDHYDQCVTEFEDLHSIWNDVYETLSSKERQVMDLVATGQSKDQIRASVERLLGESSDFVIKSLAKVDNGAETESEIFRKVLVNELEAIYKTLKVVAPQSTIINQIEPYIREGTRVEKISEIEEEKTKSVKIASKRSISPGIALRSSSGSPPTTSFVNTFGTTSVGQSFVYDELRGRERKRKEE